MEQKSGVGTDINLFNEQNYNYLADANIDASGLILAAGSSSFGIIYIPVSANTAYTISANQIKNFVIFTTNAVPAVGVQGTPRIVVDAKEYTLTTNSDTKYLCLRNSKASGNVQNYLGIELKVQEGSVATKWSPYRTWNGRNNKQEWRTAS